MAEAKRASLGNNQADTHEHQSRRHPWEIIKLTFIYIQQSKGHPWETIKRAVMCTSQQGIPGKQSKIIHGQQNRIDLVTIKRTFMRPVKRTSLGNHQADIHGQQ